jgi:hypothetical protein
MAIDKEVVKEFNDDFKPQELVEAAMRQIVNSNKEESISQIRKLREKEYQQRRELHEAKQKVVKIEEGLKKTSEKFTKLLAGDMSVLFEGQKEVAPEN